MKSRVIRLMKYGIISGSILLAIFVVVTFSSIYFGVKKYCLIAKSEFSGDCQQTLVQYIGSENRSFKEKNHAIWALGQLADPRSVESLESLESSIPQSEKCQHDKDLCSYEIQKALKWSRTGNITSWMYRSQNEW